MNASKLTQAVPPALVPDGILETVLYAADLEALETFYRDIMGMEPFAKSAGRQVFYKCGGQMLLIFNPEATQQNPEPGALPIPPHGAIGVGHVCFRASGEAIDQWEHHLRERGVEIIADFQWPQGRGRSLYFLDPAGNCLEFAEPRIWGLS